MDPTASSTAIAEMYRRHAHVVLRRARVLLGDESEAQEILQDVFVRLVDDPERFGGRSSVTTWLYRVTTNMCFNRIRDRQNRRRLLDERVAPAATGVQRATAEAWASASQLVAQLPDELATALVYYYVDGMTHLEIAELLGCSRRHAGNLVSRATEALRARARDTGSVPAVRTEEA